MKIVIAPDSFKESLTALEAATAIEAGMKKILPEAIFVKVPMADGGEGTVQSLVDATHGRIVSKTVTGPLGDAVDAFFGLSGDEKTAIIEMAAASGLHLVPREKRNPLITTTRGTGELIVAALDYGVEQIIIGIGGSATNDGGAGMARALGIRFLNADGKEIGEGGGSLSELVSIDRTQADSRLTSVKIEVACDVDNPLTGTKGASRIFGPQKGATAEIIEILDKNLHHYAEIIRKDLGKDIEHISGAGAAGGLGGGLLAFLSAELKRGVDIVLEATKLEQQLLDADFVITGEGKIDGQTIFGKTPIGVAKTAKRHNIPVIAIAGNVAKDSVIVHEHGIDVLFSVVPGAISLEDALENASTYVRNTAANIASLIKLAK
ncbi:MULTISPECIES: glycerate kinase [Mesobacillus]|uniref:Glycerate kinase n=2 Tax=Mesobacillus TaxID=2675231 RepID=A0A0D6ZCV2_9BACI|nr:MULTISPECIES: glycerate kinase [Mesobacillus]KIY23362.1 glycerate kinase [Mesobacillus subterraneus]MDQ0413165.1 glycerate kinase [Mesobacillus stamsii]